MYIYICIYFISVYTYQETYRRSSKDGTIGQYLLGPLESLASDSPWQPLPIWTLLADHWKGYLAAITTCAELWNAAEIRKAQGNTVESKWSIKGNILVLNILADLSSSDFGMMDYFVCRPFGERSWSSVQYLVVSVGKWLITPVYSSYQYHEYGIVRLAQWQLGNRVPTGVIHSPLHLPHATCALCQVSQDLVAPKVAFMGKHVDCFPCWC